MCKKFENIFEIYKILYYIYIWIIIELNIKFCYEEIVYIFINRNKQFIINSTQVIFNI